MGGRSASGWQRRVGFGSTAVPARQNLLRGSVRSPRRVPFPASKARFAVYANVLELTVALCIARWACSGLRGQVALDDLSIKFEIL
jgi:hypothetical protein